MEKLHAVVVPFPAQGHVLPLVELSHRLVELGFRVTLVCTEFDHNRIMAALRKETQLGMEGLCFAAVPDGLEPEDDRSDVGRLGEFIEDAFAPFFEDLLRKLMEEDEVSYVVADLCVGSALVVAKKMGVPGAGFWPASSGLLALSLHIPKLIEYGIIDSDGKTRIHNQTIQLSPSMPEMSTIDFWWSCFDDPETRKVAFRLMVEAIQAATLVDDILCNSFAGIEAPALGLIPKSIPIGPLLSTNRTVSKPVGSFWAEDSSCLTWLDQQHDRSVIYVAFGSFTVLNQAQFEELAAGLEQSGRPFLWVVRPNLMTGSAVAYPEKFLEKVGERGKIVSWAPQQKVLAHRAVACFVSHCGWNSTTEGLSNGVPFLCWPYFADQFFNQKYICEVWKIGFELKPNEDGIITRREIRGKVEALFCDEGLRRRVTEIEEMVERSGRISVQNLGDFVKRIKVTTN